MGNRAAARAYRLVRLTSEYYYPIIGKKLHDENRFLQARDLSRRMSLMTNKAYRTCYRAARDELVEKDTHTSSNPGMSRAAGPISNQPAGMGLDTKMTTVERPRKTFC